MDEVRKRLSSSTRSIFSFCKFLFVLSLRPLAGLKKRVLGQCASLFCLALRMLHCSCTAFRFAPFPAGTKEVKVHTGDSQLRRSGIRAHASE